MACSSPRNAQLPQLGALLRLLAALLPASLLPTALLPAAALAGHDRTHLFPGSREGGGTRGVCESRRVALLVPEAGSFRPAADAWVGLLEGEAPQPVPLAVRIDGLGERTLVARPAGVRLLHLHGFSSQAALWESFPRCASPGSPEAAAEGLGEPPPARALLQGGAPRADDGSADARAALARLAAACSAGDASVPTAPLLTAFAYGHLAAGLPERLPLHCEHF